MQNDGAFMIRPANTEDTKALEMLFMLTRQHTFANRNPGEFKIGDYQKSTAEDEVWVAEVNGIIVGFVSIYVADNFIHNLFVLPAFHARGFGVQLLQMAENHLLRPMTLKIAMDNLAACGFYEKYGWYEYSVHSDEPEPYLLYRKN